MSISSRLGNQVVTSGIFVPLFLFVSVFKVAWICYQGIDLHPDLLGVGELACAVVGSDRTLVRVPRIGGWHKHRHRGGLLVRRIGPPRLTGRTDHASPCQGRAQKATVIT
jgi:hypothetical protein